MTGRRLSKGSYSMGMYAQYGCGLSAPDGWLNFDVSPTLRLQRLPVVGAMLKVGPKWPAGVRHGDIRNGLPIGDGVCDGMYCSHVLEHLSLEDFRLTLKQTLRHLKPGGVFRLVVPDLRVYAERYVADTSEPAAAHKFMEATYLGQHTRPKSLGDRVKDMMGNSAHRWMWDYPAMMMELEKAGFTDIRRAKFNDAVDPAFKAVEDAGRWTDAVCIECRRPK